MMQNNLFLQRLVVYTNSGKVAYDEVFHKGINIICGDNSSGKSTITHFIFFALGGSFKSFVPEARECQVVFAEIISNGTIITLKRYIVINEKTNNINASAAIHIYWGSFEESLNPSPEKYWQKYEYNSTSNKKSFSNVLFEIFGLPEVKEESNITIHQILRLLYIDQESPTSSLFYFEEFDKQNIRDAVADLLLGVYNQDLYDLKLKLYNNEKDLEDIKSEIRITKRFIPDNFALNIEHLKTQIENKEGEIAEMQTKIDDIRSGDQKVEYNEKSHLEFQLLQENVIANREKVYSLKNYLDILTNEILDSEYFIEALQDKYRSLNNSIETRDFLGGLHLEFCPACLNKLNEHVDDASCKLCKQTSDDNLGIKQAKRMQLEIRFQIDESTKLLKFKNLKLEKLNIEYKAQLTVLQDLQIRVNDSVKDVRPFEQERLDNLNFDKGLAEGEILQFRTMLEQAQIFENLLNEKVELDKSISKLRYSILTITRDQIKVKKEVIEKIQEEGVYLLNNDLERQTEFLNADPQDLIIDFSNNLVYLKSSDATKYKLYQKFSASSNFYLKISARFAIFLASLSLDRMRFPRFIFADNMEDKGIEIERAQNLQDILIKRVSEFSDENYQMIYTTSYITDELRESKYIVGEYYTNSNHSLKNIQL